MQVTIISIYIAGVILLYLFLQLKDWYIECNSWIDFYDRIKISLLSWLGILFIIVGLLFYSITKCIIYFKNKINN